MKSLINEVDGLRSLRKGRALSPKMDLNMLYGGVGTVAFIQAFPREALLCLLDLVESHYPCDRCCNESIDSS